MWGPEVGTSVDKKAIDGYGGREAGEPRLPQRPLQGPGENRMRLRSPFFILTVLAFLTLFFLNTWQGYRCQTLEREVQVLEREQKEWLEKNKKVIAALAVLSSPERVVRLAVDRLGLKPLETEDVLEVVVGDEAVD
jgi:hypothetical protein